VHSCFPQPHGFPACASALHHPSEPAHHQHWDLLRLHSQISWSLLQSSLAVFSRQCCKQGSGSGEGLQLALGTLAFVLQISSILHVPCSDASIKLLGNSDMLLQCLGSDVTCSQNTIPCKVSGFNRNCLFMPTRFKQYRLAFDMASDCPEIDKTTC